MRYAKSQRPLSFLPLVCSIAFALATLQPAYAQNSASSIMEKIRGGGKLALGYRTDNAPMSYRDAAGKPAGYAVTLCQKVIDGIKMQLQTSSLDVEWIAVDAATALPNVQQNKIDLLCNAESTSLAQRQQVSFSTPIFLNGIAGIVSTSLPLETQKLLENRPPPYKPAWRGNVPTQLQHRTASVVSGTPAVAWVAERINTFKLLVTVSTEESYAAGVAKVAEGKSDAIFGDRAQLLALTRQHPDTARLKMLNRHFTYETQALALPRNDDDFRLAVDRALANFIGKPQFGELYASTFGAADDETIEFFRGTPH